MLVKSKESPPDPRRYDHKAIYDIQNYEKYPDGTRLTPRKREYSEGLDISQHQWHLIFTYEEAPQETLKGRWEFRVQGTFYTFKPHKKVPITQEEVERVEAQIEAQHFKGPWLIKFTNVKDPILTDFIHFPDGLNIFAI